MKRFTYSLIVFFLVGCFPNKVSTEDILIEFCNVNKQDTFNVLYKAIVATRSFKVNNNTGLYYPTIYKVEYFDSTSGEYVLFPPISYPGGENEIFETFRDLNKKAMLFVESISDTTDEQSVQKAYVALVSSILKEYKSIKMPLQYGYESVWFVKGKPTLGRFIRFELSEGNNVYYVKDYSSITDMYKKSGFNKSIKVNDIWYYQLKDK